MDNKLAKCVVLSCMLVLICPVFGQDETHKVVGRVVDAQTGEALSGVSIGYGETTNTTKTDNDGQYSINVPSLNAVMRFSYVGFRYIEERIGNRTKINVALVKDVTNLEKIVEVGKGTQGRKDVRCAFHSLSTDKIKKKPQIKKNKNI